MTPKVTVVIVSYNTREMTLECLRSAITETQSTIAEFIVVDNMSNDGSADAIEAQFPQVRVVRATENLGFARANNFAAKEAKGEYLLLLNPDTLVLDRAIDRLVEFAEAHPDARIWGGRTLNADRSLNPASCWRRMTLWSLVCSATGLSMLSSSPVFASESYGGWKRDTVREVDIVTGCFLLIKKQFWDQLEGFDPAYFMYGEEADLCLRAKRLGARPMVTPDASIVHYSSAQAPVRADKMVGVFKAKVTLIRGHWPRTLRKVGELLFLVGPLTRSLGYSAAAILLGERAKNRAKVWSEVWRRRDQWFSGYSGVRQA